MGNMTNKTISVILSLVVFAVVLLSVTACGSQGPRGEQGIPGADGLTPTIGENGNWWLGNYDTGVAAVAQNGRDGVDGKDGSAGIDGKNGRDGMDGKDGKDAITPKFLYNNGMIYVSYDNEVSWDLLVEIDKLIEDGKDGKDGVSIISSKINEEGELVIHYSTGNSENLGNVVGKDGVNGKDGTNGENGQNGISVTSCSINDKGELVISYSDGRNETIGRVVGTDGEDGTDGKDGTDGTNGSDGVNGKDGISVTFCEINEKGELIISYSNETSVNLGVVVGTNGTNGINGTNGTNGKDGVTPRLKINTATRQWEVSYDNGSTWIELGFTATGADGVNGSDGTDGKNGVTPRLKIDTATNQWQVSYDNGENWESLGVVATGPAGNDGMATIVKIGNDGYWYLSKNNGSSWESTGVKAEGIDGENGSEGRGIEKMEIIDGYLWVTYTDSNSPVNIGRVSQSEENAPGENEQIKDVYTDSLAFYPLGDGNEYGVSIGNALYMESIVIPSTYNGKPVTTILSHAFERPDGDNTVLKSVTIPNSVLKIGEDAFSFCISISDLTIPSSVVEIGSHAFTSVQCVTFEIDENEVPEGQAWSIESLGCFEIIWNK